MPEGKITIRTIAREFGVAESTVSRAFQPNSRISDSLRQRILAYAEAEGYVPNKAAARLSMKELNVGYLCVTAAPPYPYAVGEFDRGLRDAYNALFDLKIHLHRETVIAPEADPTRLYRLQAVLDAWQSFDGIIVLGYYTPPEIDLLNAYSADGRPLVLLQNNQPAIDRLFVSCLDATAANRMAAEFIGDCLRRSPGRTVALFTGDRSVWLHSEAERVFREAEAKGGFDIVAAYDMKDQESLLYAQLTDLYEARALSPDAIYISSGISAPLTAYLAARRLPIPPTLVTFDVTPRISQALVDGIVTATVDQNLYRQAVQAFTGLVEFIVGRSTPAPVVTPAPALVLRSNLAYHLQANQ